jgi:HK97 gp10 family phage protein
MRSFHDIEAFIAHLSTLEKAVHQRTQEGLRHAAARVEQTAKEQLGTYQPAVGSFNAWPKLAPKTLEQHARMGVGDTPLLVTGKLRDSIGYEVEDNAAIVGTKLPLAAAQEFGTDRIPPRPFMGPALHRNIPEIEKIMGEALFAAMTERPWMPDND